MTKLRQAMTPKLNVLVLAGLVMLALSACQGGSDDEAADHRPLVRVASIEHGQLNQERIFSGTLLPSLRADLAFQSSGIIDARPGELGQAVRRGDLLATLRNPRLAPAEEAAAARLREAITRRDQAERELARLAQLVETGAVGQERHEQQAAELDAQNAAVRQAEAQLAANAGEREDAILRAPFDGLVSAVHAEPGEFIQAGVPVLSIGALDPLEFEIQVPAAIVSRLEAGQLVTVRLPQLGEDFTSDASARHGRIQELGLIGASGNGLFPVVVRLESAGAQPPGTTMAQAARPGMLAEVRLAESSPSGWLLPLASVVSPVGTDAGIYTISDERAHWHPVRILARQDQRVLAEGDLELGQVVAIAGLQVLSEGQPVRVVP